MLLCMKRLLLHAAKAAVINDSKKKKGNQLPAPICPVCNRIWAVCQGCDNAFSDSQPHTAHKSVKCGCFLYEN
eukprot:1736368-Ditylum_brightwellii.AAC.1